MDMEKQIKHVPLHNWIFHSLIELNWIEFNQIMKIIQFNFCLLGLGLGERRTQDHVS